MQSSIVAGFEAARKEFLCHVEQEHIDELSRFASIDDVYNATDEIQKKQGETRTLQNLSKIQPYLQCLDQYTGVLETIVQIKPDLLAIIWVVCTLNRFENVARS